MNFRFCFGVFVNFGVNFFKKFTQFRTKNAKIHKTMQKDKQ